MRKLIPASAILSMLLLLAAYPVNAQGFSSVIDDSNLRVSVSYPPEVKIGTCFQLVVEATALVSNVDIDDLRITVKYITGSTPQILLDVLVVDNVNDFTSTSQIYLVCVPTTSATDPTIVAELRAIYTVAGSPKNLNNNWFLAVARQKTYVEVATELQNALDTIDMLNDQINSLNNQINSLRAQVNRLQALLDEANDEINILRTRLQHANARIAELEAQLQARIGQYNQLKQQYDKLTKEFEELNRQYRQALENLASLQTKYEDLRARHEQLNQNYNKLLEDYRRLTNDYAALQSSYQLLSENYENLKERHDAALKQVGQLQSQLETAKQDYQALLMNYNSLKNENQLTRSIVFAQAAGLVGIAAAASTLYYLRRRRGTGGQAVQPSAEGQSANSPAEATQAEGEKSGEYAGSNPEESQANSSDVRVQKILSGRRITVPSNFLTRLGLHEGDRLMVEVREDHVVIRPAPKESGEDGRESENN